MSVRHKDWDKLTGVARKKREEIKRANKSKEEKVVVGQGYVVTFLYLLVLLNQASP